MKNPWGKIVRGLLGLPLAEIRVEKRGFRGATDEMRSRLEQIGESFLDGYHAGLQHSATPILVAHLNRADAELRGFAFEGAAMALALLDTLTPWRRNRLTSLVSGAGDAHAYMLHVGAGWVWARFPFGFRRYLRRLDPLLGWLAFDGWGFHEGFFHWHEYTAGRAHPRALTGYEKRVFDQGLGRSWWFVNGGRADLIARTIAGFPPERRSDMWSGVGLAATYAGIASESALRSLCMLSGPCRPQLAQGSAFAAKARQRAGNNAPHTELAAVILCGQSAAEAARSCDLTLENLSAAAAQPAYETWRQRLQQHFRALFEPTSPLIKHALP